MYSIERGRLIVRERTFYFLFFYKKKNNNIISSIQGVIFALFMVVMTSILLVNVLEQVALYLFLLLLSY